MTETNLLSRSLAACMLAAFTLPSFAHGDEPHGDEPHAPASAVLAPGAAPHFEAATELFEAVGRLEGGVLTLFINRFETNEPVAQASVELESGNLKAEAAYRAGQGSYVVEDAGFVQALGQPGRHALVMTITAGADADLLDALVEVAAAPVAADADALASMTPVLAGGLGLGALAAGALLVRRRHVAKGAAK